MNLSIRHWLEEHQIELLQLDQSGGVAFGIVQEMERQSLTVFDISVLAEVLSLPLVVARTQMQPLSQLTGSLLRQLSHKKPLKRNEGTWLAFQIAYLNGLLQLLEQEELLHKPWMNRRGLSGELVALPSRHRGRGLLEQPLEDSELLESLKTISPGRLSDTQAEQALSEMGNSDLVQRLSRTTKVWLVANGAEETEAKLLTGRLNHGLSGHLLACIALHSIGLPQLQKFVRLGNTAGLSETLIPNDNDDLLSSPVHQNSLTPSIDLNRERYRASFIMGLSEAFFEECFALKDLYVPPMGIPKAALSDSLQASTHEAVDLMEWLEGQLQDRNSFAVIEAPPGYGKTSFCQIWAAKVASELYPDWMPLLVQLRHATLGYTLEQTLDSALPIANFTCADGWLSPVAPDCLLILDGLEELPHSPLAEDPLWLLFDQLLRFQSRYRSRTGKPRHKIVLTCRTGTLGNGNLFGGTSLQTLVEARLRRIEIQPMGQEQLKKWFKNWSRLQTKNIAQTYFDFLKRGGMFRRDSARVELKAMVHQPLMLYLLGILHRDGLLDEGILQMPYPQVKFEIYDRLVTWLLGEPTAGLSSPIHRTAIVQAGLSHAGRSREAIANLLGDTPPQELRHQMLVAALKIGHSGRAWATQTGPLPAFYFRSVSANWPMGSRSQGLSVEFSHPHLGEYLCAEQIATKLKSLTSTARDAYGELTFEISSPAVFAQEIYNLLGYGILSMEMEELIAERLWREEARDRGKFRFRTLFARLHSFYISYCRGRWMDEGMAHSARDRFGEQGNPLNALQIDAAVGVNVFVLLCACGREAQIPFSPCDNSIGSDKLTIGQFDVSNASRLLNFNPSQLLVLARRTAVLSPTIFWARVRHTLKNLNLRGAYLNRAMLAGGSLQQSDLEAAVLIEANLTEANLKATNLSWANLTAANLSGANLSGTNLEGANLTGANLHRTNITSANLTNACLFQAQMDEKTKNLAKAKGAFFSSAQFQAYSQAIGSQSLKDLSRTPTFTHSHEQETSVLPIEMAEDEPVVYSTNVAQATSTFSTQIPDLQGDIDTVVLDQNSGMDNS
ncbi:MAG: pentapeptide repeat-containing protein [Hormoscilla sp.]